jgi:predicted DNA-binding transcriptional regulator YafY
MREGWKFRDLPGGGGLVEFDADDRAAAIRFVARYADRARVVAPEPLRREALAYFRGILATHEGAPTDPSARKPAGSKKGSR